MLTKAKTQKLKKTSIPLDEISEEKLDKVNGGVKHIQNPKNPTALNDSFSDKVEQNNILQNNKIL